MPQNKAAKTPPTKTDRTRENGNVFLFILIGVVLFAALSFTVSRGFQSTTTSNLSKRQAELAASDILNYAAQVERAVNRLRRNGCSENDISFANEIVSGYEHTPEAPDTCKVFHPDGGKLNFSIPSEGINDGSPFYFTGSTCLEGIPREIGDCIGSDGVSNEELTLVLPNVNIDLCIKINDTTGVTNPSDAPPQDGGISFLSSSLYRGSFNDGSAINGSAHLRSQPTACYEGGTNPPAGTYHFYHVLIGR